ncbi:MAG: polyketide synthase, partial [Planctomycetaceae bacterium]
MSADYRTVPLAVVGMACRFPGADDLDAFWRLLEEGRSGISELPPDRLDQRLYYDPDRNSKETSYSRIGGIVPTRPLNRDVCPVPDDVASQFDETHLAICEVACTAMRDAGYHSQRRPPENTGVYIGNCTGSNLEADLVYRSHAGELGALLCEVAAEDLNGDVLQAAATAFAESIRNSGPSWRDGPVREVTAAAAARLVSGTLDLRGPSLAVDAACVSSFVALHLAGMALHRGRIDAAIVGAFSYRNWWEMVLLSSTQTLGPDQSCPFSAAAGGMVPADGYAALIVKTLPRALKDGDRIHGVIRALGFSSDGRGKSFWAPRQEGQMAAVRRAYEHGIEPQFVQYVEAHGTSTQLGDATEMATLQESLGGAVRGPVPVGSVKANIGHTLEVAGLAGLIKTLLAMRHGVVPASIHCEPLSPGIDWANPAFRVPVEAEPWTTPVDGRPRRAGIDSFGIGGLNVHVVVDESPAGLEPARETANETAGDDLAVIGVAAPVAEAPLVRQLLDLTGHQRTAVTAADYVFDWKKHRIPPKEVANANPL